jgi:thioredoxin:protein disulfide reductase
LPDLAMKNALLILLLMPALALAKPWWLKDSSAKEADFLQPDEAFRVSARVDGELLRVRWSIADGYYLYRSKFDITAESPELTLDKPVFPSGISKTDEYFGTQEIFQHEVESIVGFKRGDAGAHPLQIKVTYQGCAEAGLCYPPLVKVLYPEAAPPSTALAGAVASPLQVAHGTTPQPAKASASSRIPLLGVIAGLGGFLLAGLALRRRFSTTTL